MSIDKTLSLLRDIVTKLGYTKLTEIQIQAFPKILLSDNDILISAPTGSGKTEAAIIPSIIKFIKNLSPISIIYITPLRALNRDISERLTSIMEILRLRVDVWHGDTTQSNRKKILKAPPNILITTPESLQILLIRHEFNKFLTNLKTIIIDELQELISSERGVELVLSLERIDRKLNRHIRRIAISSPLEDLDKVARYFFGDHNYEIIVAGTSNKIYDINVKLSSMTYENGIFNIRDVINIISDVIESNLYKQILLFTNTRIGAEELGFHLTSHLYNYTDKVGLHHGSLSRNIRESVEKGFKYGDIKLVISTSSLELGIDIGTIDLVIQYLSPRQALKLIQRVGRSGHREGLVSKGLIVIPPILSELFESIVIARRAKHKLLEPPIFHYNALDVLAHQILGIAIEYEKIDPIQIWKIVTSTTPFLYMPLEKIEEMMEFLSQIGLLRRKDNVYEPTKKGIIYYLTTNMIPDSSHFYAKSLLDGKTIGLLDEDFVLTCNIGDIIVLGGRAWSINGIDLEKRRVWLSPPESLESSTLPRWVGENIPVHKNVARETCAFIRRFCLCNEEKCMDKLGEFYSLSSEVKMFLVKHRDRICKLFPLDNRLIVEISNIVSLNQSLIGFYHCLGSRASEAFSLIVASLIKQLLGLSVSYRSHQLGSVILVNGILTPNDIVTILRKLVAMSKDEELLRKFIYSEIQNTPLFKWKLIEVAKKLGIISKNADSSEVKRLAEGLIHLGVVVEETLREIILEKVDIDEVIRYIRNLGMKKYKVKIVRTSNPSPYLTELSSLGTFGDILRSSMIPKDIMVELTKRRLLERGVKVMCSMCYKVQTINIKEKVEKCNDIFKCSIVCPYCGSRALTIIDENESINKIINIFNKIKNGLKLSEEEKTIFEKHSKIINMVIEYGIAFLIALQGRGIGIEYAKRILAKSRNLEDLLLNIIEQEKTYLRTFHYWAQDAKNK